MYKTNTPTELQKIVWQPTIGIDGRKYDVPIDIITNSSEPEVHFYGGLGEETHATTRAVQMLGDLNIRAAGVILPFHHLEPTQANIRRTVVEAPHVIVQEMNNRIGKPADTKVNLVGKSQGGGLVLLTASEAPELFNAIASWAPAGLTNEFLGTSVSDRQRQFLWRLIARNNMRLEQWLIPGTGNPTGGWEIVKRAASDIRAHRLEPKLRFAMDIDDAPERTKTLAFDHPLRIFAGEQDPVFKVAEILHTLGRVGLEGVVKTIPGSHASLLTKMAKTQLAIIVDWLKPVMYR